jgi:hypothetical protein
MESKIISKKRGGHSTDLLDGQATGSCPDGFFYKASFFRKAKKVQAPGNLKEAFFE